MSPEAYSQFRLQFNEQKMLDTRRDYRASIQQNPQPVVANGPVPALRK